MIELRTLSISRRGRFLVLLIMAMALTLGSGCSKEAKRDRFIKRANHYFEAKDYPKATIEYLNAAQLDPENPVCTERLGQIYFAQGQLARAQAWLRKSLAQNPARVELMVPLMRIYREAHDSAKASSMAVDILKLQPGNEEAFLTLADFATTPEQNADLEARVEKLRASGQNSAVYQLATGILGLKRRDYQKTEAALKQALELNPKSPFVHSALGNFYVVRGNIEAAREQYNQQIAMDPGDLFSRVHFAEFKLMAGARAEARKDLETIAKENPEFIPAGSLLASLALEEQRFEECAALVKKTLAQEPADFQSLLVQARLSLARTNISEAIIGFQQLKRTYARVPQVNLELARAYLATNDLDNAVSALNEALAVNPNFADALFLKGQVTFRQGDYASAQNAFTQLNKQNPQFVPAQLALADVHQARGAPEEALTIYKNIAAAFPTNAQPLFLQSLVFSKQGKAREAENALQQALKLEPGYLPALYELLDLKTQQKDFPAADNLVKQIEALKPPDALLFFARARLQLAKHDSAGAEGSLRDAIRLNPNFSPAYEMLSGIYLATHRGDEALASFNQTLEKFPRNLTVLLQKAVLLNSMSNYVESAKAYERLLEEVPQSIVALNNLAYLYSQKLNRTDRAYELAQKARRLAPDEGTVADTFGWILYQRRDYALALAPLSEAAAKLPKDPEVQFHFGMASYMRGDEKKAESLLRRALALTNNFNGSVEALRRLEMLDTFARAQGAEALPVFQKILQQQPDDPIALRHLAALQFDLGDWTGARASYERLLVITPRSVPALMKLAALYSEQFNHPQKAFDLAKQARVLEPGNAEVAHTLGRLAWRCGEQEWAVNVLQEQVQKQSSPAPELLYDFGLALYSVGRISESQESVRRALQLSPAPKQAELARQFLTLTASTNPPSAAMVTQAKALLASDPNYLPALMIVGSSLQQSGDVTGARQIYSKVMTLYPKFTPALRALALLPSPADHESQSYELAMKARKAFPRDPAVALVAGRALFKRGDYAAARIPLQEAVSATSEDPEAFYYLGMTFYKTGDRPRALENLRQAVSLGLPGALAEEVSKVLIEADTAGRAP